MLPSFYASWKGAVPDFRAWYLMQVTYIEQGGTDASAEAFYAALGGRPSSHAETTDDGLAITDTNLSEVKIYKVATFQKLPFNSTVTFTALPLKQRFMDWRPPLHPLGRPPFSPAILIPGIWACLIFAYLRDLMFPPVSEPSLLKLMSKVVSKSKGWQLRTPQTKNTFLLTVTFHFLASYLTSHSFLSCGQRICIEYTAQTSPKHRPRKLRVISRWYQPQACLIIVAPRCLPRVCDLAVGLQPEHHKE